MGGFDLPILSWAVPGNSTDIIPAWTFRWHPKHKVDRSSVQTGGIVVCLIHGSPAIADRVPSRVH